MNQAVQGGKMCFIMVLKNLFKLRGIKGAIKGVSGGFKVHQGVQGTKCVIKLFQSDLLYIINICYVGQ